MTLALMGATLLGELLRGPGDERRFPREYQRGLAARLRTVWSMSTGEDFRRPTTSGRASFGTRLGHRYFDALLELCTNDADLTRTVSRVLQLLDPPERLVQPRLALRALARLVRG
jgi:hypothetical protein